MSAASKYVDIGFKMHLREWSVPSDQPLRAPFLLVHGLSSNARTWDSVAVELARAGHPVLAIDQRGHGLSEKPPVAAGYDFATVTADILALLDTLDWPPPFLAGQSWGGNVALALGAAHPGRTRGLVFVDGGFLAAKRRAPVWEDAYKLFRPPDFAGVTRHELQERIREFHPDWSDEGIAATMANFEIQADGTVRPWLSLERHMTIFRALWEQDPATLFPLVSEPVLVCPAGNPHMGDKRDLVDAAVAGLDKAEVHWFQDTAHDIHVHRPVELARVMLDWAARQDQYRNPTQGDDA